MFVSFSYVLSIKQFLNLMNNVPFFKEVSAKFFVFDFPEIWEMVQIKKPFVLELQ